MKLKKLIPVSLGLLLIVVTGFAQTADQVVNQYFDALGGKEKLDGIKTMYAEGEMTIMNNPAPVVTYVVDGKGYKSQMEFNGKNIINCYSVNSGWTVNPLAGIPDPVQMPAEQVNIGKMTYDLKGPLFNYAAKGSKLEMAGKEKLEGTDVYKLKLTRQDSTEMVFYIDATKYLLLQMTLKLNVGGNKMEIVTVNSNYQMTSFGLLMPFTTETRYPGLTITTTSKVIDINKDIDLAVFEMPKK